jgi:glyoxylase-like metal-dependent hydrolase (beta-lactamase superfamily II)
MIFRQLLDPETSTWTYIVGDARTHEALLLDGVLEQVDRDLELIEQLGLRLRYAIETHVHADHVTSAWVVRQRTGARIVTTRASRTTGADDVLDDGDTLKVGSLVLQARSTPGHTDSCTTWVLESEGIAFTGDALLVRGCGRTDFQQGDPRQLYRSVHQRIFALPDDTLLYPGHDYKGRTVTTVREEKVFNPRLGGGRSEDEFVAIMDALKLAPPKRIDVAVPANLTMGRAFLSAGSPARDE